MSYNIDWSAVDDYANGGLNDGANRDDGTTGPGTTLDSLPAPVAADLTDDTTTTNTRGMPNAGPSVWDQGNSLAAAQATNASAGQPNPGDVAAMNGNQPFPRRFDTGDGTPPSVPGSDQVPTAPGLPNPGTGPAAGGGRGQLSDADWANRFQGTMGYYDPQYESRAAFLEEAAQGDKAIRGQQAGGPHIDELAKMAQYDSDAKRLYDAIQSRPDFYNSQNAAQWDLNHNGSLAAQAQGLTGVSNQQVAAAGYNGPLGGAPSRPAPQGTNTGWLQSQVVNTVANPMDNAHALMSDTLRNSLVDALGQLGAKDFQMVKIDAYGNMGLAYTAKNGTPEVIKASLPDYASALDTLRQRVAAQIQPPAAGSGGGGGRPNYAPRGGGGGGGGQPAAPPYGVGVPGALEGGEAVTSTIPADMTAAQRIQQFFPTDQSRQNVPRSVGSAVAYAPGIYPGGYSPYDQP